MSKPHCGNPRARHRMRDVRLAESRAQRHAERRVKQGDDNQGGAMNSGAATSGSPRASEVRTEAGRALLDLLHQLSPGGHYSDRVAAVEGEAVSQGAALSGAALQAIRAALVDEVQDWVMGGHVDVGAAFDRACIKAATQ